MMQVTSERPIKVRWDRLARSCGWGWDAGLCVAGCDEGRHNACRAL